MYGTGTGYPNDGAHCFLNLQMDGSLMVGIATVEMGQGGLVAMAQMAAQDVYKRQLQYGAVPVFVDVTVPQYNIDISQLEAARSSRTKAVMIAHTLGNPFDLAAVKAFCDRYGLWLVEDNCDALGSIYFLDGEKHFTGTIGDIGTCLLYTSRCV